MHKFILTRILAMIPVVLGVIFIIFLILYLAPGDVAAVILGSDYTPEAGHAIREQLGLNRPFLVQYFDYVLGLLRGDFGTSYITNAPVSLQIAARFPNTLLLVTVSMFLCTVFSLPIGIASATKPNSILSNVSAVFAIIGLALPTFWQALLFILLFSVYLGWLPSTGSATLAGIILPSITLATTFMAGTMRTTRSSMLEALHQDYVRTARAKGVSRRKVVHKHALRNALLPVITVIGVNVGMQLGGSVLTETVFSYPGMGRLLISGINQRDTPTVLSCLVVLAICIAVINLLVDLIYAFVDPRIKSMFSKRR
jgi:peptide/nickel transport system permease protein